MVQEPPHNNSIDHESPQPFDPDQQPINRLQSNLSERNQVNTLAVLAHALEPNTVQGPSPQTPGSSRSALMEESSYSINTGTSTSRNPTRLSIDDDHQNGSYGTLMIGNRGRSKYLGPTAGSEWLKEVIYLYTFLFLVLELTVLVGNAGHIRYPLTDACPFTNATWGLDTLST